MSEPIKMTTHREPTDSGLIRGTSSQDIVRDNPRNPLRTKFLVAGITLALLLTAAYFYLPQWFSTDRTVARTQLRIDTVERQEFIRDISVQGIVVAAVAPTVYSSSPGIVTLSAAAGDQIAKGDLIATIKSPELSNELEREEATSNSLETNLQRQTISNKKSNLIAQQSADMAQIELTAAKRELRRAEKSWSSKVISLQDFEKAKDDVERATYELEHAKRAAALDKESLRFELQTLRLERDRQLLVVKNLKRRTEELNLRAPVDGMVGTLAIDDRAVVAANTAIATVVDLSALEVELSISDGYADELLIGTPVSIKFNSQDYKATLVSVSPEVINSMVKARVRFDQDQPPGLRQNQRVSARIVLEIKNDALLVERGPFYDSGGGRVIYRIFDDIAERVEIQTGSTSVEYIEVTHGLNSGDQVIISEIDRFKGAQRILLRD